MKASDLLLLPLLLELLLWLSELSFTHLLSSVHTLRTKATLGLHREFREHQSSAATCIRQEEESSQSWGKHLVLVMSYYNPFWYWYLLKRRTRVEELQNTVMVCLVVMRSNISGAGVLLVQVSTWMTFFLPQLSTFFMCSSLSTFRSASLSCHPVSLP